MAYVIGDPSFVKNLDGWLYKNEQPYANYIVSHENGIPAMFRQYTKPLFRGMVVGPDFFEQLNKGGVTMKAHSSWSKTESVAKKFASDLNYGAGQKGKMSVIIKKVVPASSVVFDIHSFVLFMGADQLEMLGLDESSIDSALKEEEVLIKKGVKIAKKDVTIF